MTVFDYLYLKGKEGMALHLLEHNLAPGDDILGGASRLEAMLRIATIPHRTERMVPLLTAFMSKM